jgi:hypothetical protein
MGVCLAVLAGVVGAFGVLSFFTFSLFSLAFEDVRLDGVAVDVAAGFGGCTGVCFFALASSLDCPALKRLAGFSAGVDDLVTAGVVRFPSPECFRFRCPFTVPDFDDFVWLAGATLGGGVVISTSEPLSDSLSELDEDSV